MIAGVGESKELSDKRINSIKTSNHNITTNLDYYHCTKNHISFSGLPEKLVFPKKLWWNMIFLVLSGKIIFLFPENMILHVGRKMKDDLS